MDSPLILSAKEALDCVTWMLSDIARRPSSTSKHQKMPLRSNHMAMYPGPGYLRGSDLSERLYVCVRVLERVGYTIRNACLEIGDKTAHLLGNSKRGRPRTIEGGRDIDSRAKAIATRVRQFALGRRQAYAAGLVDYRIDHFLFLRKAGVICGSEYIQDSGQRMHDYWKGSIQRLRRPGFS
jgi:hypothetical protein